MLPPIPRLLRVFGPLLALLAFGGGCRQPPPSDRAGSIATGTPLVVTMPSGRTDVFVLGSNGHIWQSTCRKDCTKRASFTSWSHGPGRPPGGATSDPGGIAWGEDRIDLFVRGSIANVWHQTWEDGRWFGWEDLDGRIQSFPIAASWGSGSIHLFALCGDNRLWHRSCQAGDLQPTCRALNWSAWIPDPGGPGVPATNSGDAVSNASGRIDMAIRGNDGAFWFQRWDQSGWIGWRSLGGEIASAPALLASGGRTEAYAMDIHGKFVRAFIDAVDAPLVWTPTGVDFGGEPRGVTLPGTNSTLVLSRAGQHSFRGVTCVPGAECRAMD
jgi:hypothetical protein